MSHHHHSSNEPPGMPPDASMAQANGYPDAWAGMTPYNQSPYHSPLNEYNNWGSYMPPNLPSDSISRMPPPNTPMMHQGPHHHPQQPHHHHHHPQQHHMTHHSLPMLNTQATWPSEITNPSPASGSYSMPPVTATPPLHGVEHQPRPQPQPPEKSRRTLSREQKRAMCQYAVDNPNSKQADIGKEFGVERSTVSKVLRDKDNLLDRNANPETPAPAKRPKTRHADFDRTLMVAINKRRSGGFKVTDEEIMERAKKFARGCDYNEPLNAAWLAKFKQKHSLGDDKGGRLLRRASETSIPDSARMSALPKLKKKSSSGITSPASPTRPMSPLSEGKSETEGTVQPEGLGLTFNFRSSASQSLTSLHDANNSSFSGSSALSPTGTGTFTFSPDPNGGAFLDMHPGAEHREKRSHTLPSLHIDPQVTTTTPTFDPSDPRHSISTTTSSSLESSATSLQHAGVPFSLNATMSPRLRRSGSNPSMSSARAADQSMPNPAGATTSTSSPISPTQEDARRAANTLLNYLKQSRGGGNSNRSIVDEGEYNTLMLLTQKLQFATHRPSMGGLSRIPEGDVEMMGSGEVKMETS